MSQGTCSLEVTGYREGVSAFSQEEPGFRQEELRLSKGSRFVKKDSGFGQGKGYFNPLIRLSQDSIGKSSDTVRRTQDSVKRTNFLVRRTQELVRVIQDSVRTRD